MILVLEILFFILCLLLVGVILIQPAKGEGLASAFSGAGSDSFFGARAHKTISWFTTGVAVVVLILALLINYLSK